MINFEPKMLNAKAVLQLCYISFVTMNIFPFTPGSDYGVCLLSGTRIAHEGALLIGHFPSCATLELTLHQARVSNRSLESRLVGVSWNFLETLVKLGFERKMFYVKDIFLSEVV